MKLRNDFVSNSSSSSYLITIKDFSKRASFVGAFGYLSFGTRAQCEGEDCVFYNTLVRRESDNGEIFTGFVSDEYWVGTLYNKKLLEKFKKVCDQCMEYKPNIVEDHDRETPAQKFGKMLDEFDKEMRTCIIYHALDDIQWMKKEKKSSKFRDRWDVEKTYAEVMGKLPDKVQELLSCEEWCRSRGTYEKRKEEEYRELEDKAYEFCRVISLMLTTIWLKCYGAKWSECKESN